MLTEKYILMMMGVVRKLHNAKYHNTYANRSCILYKDCKNIQEYVRCIQGGGERPQALCIFKFDHIVMLKDHQSSDHVCVMQ